MATQVCEIPKLQDLCFKVFYKNLLCKSTPTTVDFVQNCIQQQLMGTMRKTIREKSVRMLNETYFIADSENSGSQQGVVRDICTILDSILDDSFSELSINIPYSAIKLFPWIIGWRCPTLEKLVVNFCRITPKPILMEMKVQSAVTNYQAYSNSLFHCLTTLAIYYTEIKSDGSSEMQFIRKVSLHAVDEPRQSILGVVSKCCPALTTLKVRGFHFRKRDFFALLFGEWNVALFPTDKNKKWSHDSVLKVLRVPSEFLTPLCFTLKQLLFEDPNRHTTAITPSDSMYALALRHLPKLELLDARSLSARAVKAFYKAEMIESKQAEFEKYHCRDVAERIGRKRRLSGPFNYLPDGPLSLIHLHNATIDDADTLRAIASLYPHLQKVDFISSPVSESSPTISPDEIESILKKWPKLVDVIITDVNPAYIKPILSALGSNLKSLEFLKCTQLDLQPLAYCTALEELTFFYRCSIEDGAAALPSGFLPALKNVCSDSCTCTAFFRTMARFNSLKLNCCHVGTEVGFPLCPPQQENI